MEIGALVLRSVNRDFVRDLAVIFLELKFV